MKKTLNRGFTLIELLVVIAIIGILASVVLASLNSARAKGSDAAIKSSINNSRAQAEIFYDTAGNNYTSVCTNPGGIAPMHDGAASASGSAAPTASFTACASSATAWAMKSRMVSDTGNYYCVDSTGAAKTITAAYSDTAVTLCP